MICALKFSLLRGPGLLFTLASILLLAVGGWVVFSALRFIHDSRWVSDTAEVLTQIDHIAQLERGAIAAQRGYLLTADQQAEDEFWERKARLPEQMHKLRDLVQAPSVASLLAQVEPLLQKRLALAAQTVAVYERDGLAQAQFYIQRNGSLPLDLRVQQLLGQMRMREQALLSSRRAASELSAKLLLLAAILGIPLSLSMLVAVNRFMLRENAERRKSERLANDSSSRFESLSSDMGALSRFAGMLQSCEGPDELMALTSRALAAMVPNVSGSVYLIRSSRDHAQIAVKWGEEAVISAEHPAPVQCWAMRRNQPFTCADLRSDIRCAHVSMDAVDGATACYPLSAQGQLMGWLYFSKSEPGPFVKTGLALQAAEQLSLALANIRLREDLRNQSIRDPLSGLFNRRYLEESLAREVSRCTRRQLPLAVLMFDLDHFKAFNDQHGHPGGDTLLSAFGRLLQAHCRPEDIPCRFGGEEFTLILPEAGREVALQRAQAIVSATAQLIVEHQGINLGRVTTSCGLAVLPDHGTGGSALLAAADKALYRAKSTGRNRVCEAQAMLPGSPVADS